MAKIRSTGTRPERAVAAMLKRLHVGFRTHANDLPGSPDVVIPKAGVVVFVHGCFWHRHDGCRYCYTPKSRTRFWQDKFAKNVRRDRRAARALRELGWSVAVVWECRLAKPVQVQLRLARLVDH
ncbi:MAG: DNA mismatch endonuclease Vsr, partial [Phycisphaerales bacterium]|nr:DNA mismatch endonuclease Vsr [Phycisphaerales bacterium]